MSRPDPAAPMAGNAMAEEVWRCTRESLPLPGSGETAVRFEALARLGARDQCLAKLVEPHHDALAILAELGAEPPRADTLWGVWAAEPPSARVEARQDDGGWVLDGLKTYCSGAGMVTNALVTAPCREGSWLFSIDVATARSSGALELAPSDWVGDGMLRAQTRSVLMRGVQARLVGAPGTYVARPGFWHGACGVAACWLGGARAIAARLLAGCRGGRADAHTLAHLGAVTARLDAATAQLSTAADEIDADPDDRAGTAHRRALSVRASVVGTVEEAVLRAGHALGPGPLAFDAGHAQRVADLAVFIRQHHDERDLASLGGIVSGQQP